MSTEPTQILLYYRCSDGKFKYSTKQKVVPTDWNSDNQRSVSNKKINSELNRLESVVDIHIESCRILLKPVLTEEL